MDTQHENTKAWKNELIQGCRPTPGNRSRGRQRRRWTDDIIEWTGLALKQQDRLRIEIVGEESYAPPTLYQKEGIERRRRRHL